MNPPPSNRPPPPPPHPSPPHQPPPPPPPPPTYVGINGGRKRSRRGAAARPGTAARNACGCYPGRRAACGGAPRSRHSPPRHAGAARGVGGGRVCDRGRDGCGPLRTQTGAAGSWTGLLLRAAPLGVVVPSPGARRRRVQPLQRASPAATASFRWSVPSSRSKGEGYDHPPCAPPLLLRAAPRPGTWRWGLQAAPTPGTRRWGLQASPVAAAAPATAGALQRILRIPGTPILFSSNCQEKVQNILATDYSGMGKASWI